MRSRVMIQTLLLAAALVLAVAGCKSDGVSEDPGPGPLDDRCLAATWEPPVATGRTLFDLRVGTVAAAVEFRIAENPSGFRNGLVCLKFARPGDAATRVRVNLPVSIEVAVDRGRAAARVAATGPEVTS